MKFYEMWFDFVWKVECEIGENWNIVNFIDFIIYRFFLKIFFL